MENLSRASDDFASELDPDGDWNPMLFIVNGEKVTMVGFEMPENGWKRERLFSTLLPNMIHEKFSNPDSIVMLVSTWVTVTENWQEGDPLPSENPDRKEALLLQGINKDEELTYMAEIKRSESTPELDWITKGEEVGVEGRLIGCLRRAVWT